MIGREQFLAYSRQYSMIPVWEELYADMVTPIEVLRRLSLDNKDYFLLESVEEGTKIGRYSFLGYAPMLTVRSIEDGILIQEGEKQQVLKGELREQFTHVLESYQAPRIEELPTFIGGFVGYFSYELIETIEPKLKQTESEDPRMELMLIDKVIAFDHLRNKIIIIANAKAELGEYGYEKACQDVISMKAMIQNAITLPKTAVKCEVSFISNVSKETYCNMVRKTKQYIKEGDIFQGVISRKFEAEYEDSLMNAYRIMRTMNPSPYMYYIQRGDIQIAGVSPETMIKLEGGTLTTFPVAGTRKRGSSKEEDVALEKELLQDEKEVAEHNMLVDLARNDLGKVSEYGSVHVTEYMKVHKFSKVMHIASVVEGTLKDKLTRMDIISAILPAGTLSGAPKFRACEIIQEIEKVPRGIYGGAIGYLDFAGNMDFCIAIRTAVKRKNRLSIQAGAGIVADSIPELEYEECENKARAIIEAVKRASEVNEI